MRASLALALCLGGCQFAVRGLPLDAPAADLGPAPDLAIAPGVDAGGPMFRSLASGTKVNLLAVWGSGPADVYVAGEKGTILHSVDHGATWSLFAIWGAGPGNVLVSGDNGILRHTLDGNTWLTPATLTSAGRGMWGSSASDLYVVGTGYRVEYSSDGLAVTWTSTQPIGNADSFYGVWGSGPTDVFVVGNHKIIHGYSGAAAGWTTQYDGPAKFLAVAGGVTVGGAGVVLRYGNGQWAQQTSGSTETLSAVWTDGGETWIAGGNGTLLQSTNGLSYKPVVSGVGLDLNGIWGASASDLYVVGDNGTILHGP